jgi:type IV secretion system protein VirD4
MQESSMSRGRKAPSETNRELLLGWDAEDLMNRPFGFAPASRRIRRGSSQPLNYGGDSHLLTVAPTGAGKGRGVIIPNLLTYNGPVITIDPKGENYQVTARRRREMGQRVIVLDPFHIVTDKSDRLNPMDIFELDKSILDCDAEMLASMLSVGHHFADDPFWSDSASAIMAGLIAHVASTASKEDRNLNTLRGLIYHDDMDYTLAALLDKDEVVNKMARDEIVAYLSHPAERTRPSVRSTASTYIKVLGSREVAETLESSSFKLQDIVSGKPLSIYIVIPPEKLDSHKALLRLWVNTLLTAVISRRKIPEQRTLFLLDECAQLGSLPALKQAITLLRGYGLQIWSFWQDLSQLRLLYPRDWETILNNSAVLQTFGMTNHLMASEWSKVVNWDSQDLHDLDPDESLVMIQGEGCRRCRRPDYLLDPVFAGHFDPNERFSLLPKLPAKDENPPRGEGR